MFHGKVCELCNSSAQDDFCTWFNGVLTLAAGRDNAQLSLGQWSLDEKSISPIASFRLGVDVGGCLAMTGADQENDQFWIGTSTSSLLKISVKQKKVLQRVNLAVGCGLGPSLTAGAYGLAMVGKFLVGGLQYFLRLGDNHSVQAYHSIVAFDTKNGDLESSLDGNVPSRVLLSSLSSSTNHIGRSNLVSNGEAVMFSGRISPGDSYDFYVFTAEEIENEYPRVNTTWSV